MMNKLMKTICVSALVLSPFIVYGGIIGARKIVQMADEAASSGASVNDSAAKVKAFPKAMKSMTNEEAARAWLALLDGFTSEDMWHGDHVSAISVVPPPEYWGALVKVINETAGDDLKGLSRKFFGAFLAGDLDEMRSLAPAIERAVQASSGHHDSYRWQQMLSSMSLEATGAKQIAANIKKEIKEGGYVTVPDLVTLMGDKEAEILLREILLAKVSKLQIDSKKTRRLARKLAIDMVGQLKSPRWDLVYGLESETVQLYEALEKRFKVKTATKKKVQPHLGDFPAAYDDDRNYHEATAYYFLALVATDQPEKALKVIKGLKEDQIELPYGVFEQMQQAGYQQQLYDFFVKVLEEKFSQEIWQQYIELAAQLGRSDDALTLVSNKLSEAKGAHKVALLEYRQKSLLAADKVLEGVAATREIIAAKEQAYDTSKNNSDWYDLVRWQQQLYKLGEVLEDEKMMAESLEGMKTPKITDDIFYELRYWVDFLIDQGQLERAEKVLSQVIVYHAGRLNQNNYGRNVNEHIGRLIKIYHLLGKHEDILYLLDEPSYLQASDLADLNYSDLHYHVAIALKHAGRDAQALKVLKALITAVTGRDDYYARLIEWEGDKALPFLDQLFKYDQFEERPLIWKASILLNAGKLDEATKVIKQAIAIDPSDGEQGKGDRMRAYAILGAIHQAKGEAAEAKLYEGVLKAIRMSEDADDVYNAGLLKRGIQMYQDSLNHFADAYCIQSRLAIQLSEMGMHDEAARHYEKAYELMPDSFGRMESHCFGCEGAFSGWRAQTMAEKVFTRLIKEKPGKPQVHYLMGYLRSIQNRDQEALKHYQQAVKLDPDYISAWKKLRAKSDEMHLPHEMRDEISFNLLRLDPRGEHVNPGLDRVMNVKRMWSEMEAVMKNRPVFPSSLYPIKQKHKRQDRFHHVYSQIQRNAKTPGEVLAEHRVSQAVYMMMIGE